MTLKAEAEFLRLAARVAPGPSHRAQLLRLLASGLDWTLIQHLVQRHRLAPLLYSHVNALGPELVPRPVFIEWWRSYEHHARRNAMLASALARVVKALEGAGIACVPYKGPLLAQSLYGSLALRVFDDVDLLIRARDLPAVKSIAATEGYRPYYSLAPAAEAAMVTSSLQYHMIFQHTESGHLLEAHWKTDPAFPVEGGDAAWWNGLGRADLLGERVRTVSADEQLLMSCIHAMRHHGYRLSWIVDVAESLRQEPPLHWEWIIGHARRLGAWRRLAVSLVVAHDVLDAPLPENVRIQVKADAAAAGVAARITARLFERDGGSLTAGERLRLDLSLFDRLSGRVSHVLAVMFEPSFHEWAVRPLPRALYPLYLPLRLARIARKHASGGARQAAEEGPPGRLMAQQGEDEVAMAVEARRLPDQRQDAVRGRQRE